MIVEFCEDNSGTSKKMRYFFSLGRCERLIYYEFLTVRRAVRLFWCDSNRAPHFFKLKYNLNLIHFRQFAGFVKLCNRGVVNVLLLA